MYIWCINQTCGALCFNLLRCVLAIKWLLVLASGHVMLREHGHFSEKITQRNLPGFRCAILDSVGEFPPDMKGLSSHPTLLFTLPFTKEAWHTPPKHPRANQPIERATHIHIPPPLP